MRALFIVVVSFRVNPVLHIFVAGEACVSGLRDLPYADETRVRVAVIRVPESTLLLRMRLYYFRHELYCRSGVLDEDEVEVVGAGVEELKRSQSDLFDLERRQTGGRGFRVRVAV